MKKPPNWLLALLLVFSLSILGLGASFLTGSLIPFWLLFSFSIIYSIEKWFSQVTRKSKAIGKLYRLLLNLGILSILGLLIWSGIKLFSGSFHYNPVIGSLIFLAEFVFFIWVWKVVARNSWRWPSMKLTIFSLICLLLIFTFAGVQPFSTYKDNLVTNWKEYQVEQAAQQAAKEAEQAARAEREAEAEREEEAEKEAEWVPTDKKPWETPEKSLPHPQGTYLCSLHIGGTATFEGDRLTIISDFGRYTYKYEIIKDGTAILKTDIATGKITEETYKYIKEDECVVLAGLPYWKETSNPPRTEETTQPGVLDIEIETFDLINQERIEAGLHPIVWDDNLHDGARGWSENMQAEGKLYHDTAGVHSEYFAECIYGASWSYYRTPRQTVDSWMSSSGHREILMGSYRIGAIGIAKDDGFFATYRCKR